MKDALIRKDKLAIHYGGQMSRDKTVSWRQPVPHQGMDQSRYGSPDMRTAVASDKAGVTYSNDSSVRKNQT